MILAIDSREFMPGKKTGIRRHLEGLIQQLCRKHISLRIFLVVNSSCEKPPFGPNVRYLQAEERNTLFFDQVTLPGLIRKCGAQVFYSPYYKVPLLCPCPVISTVHDLMELTYEDYRENRGALRNLLMKTAARLYFMKCRAITCDSRFTLDEISRLFPGSRDKMRVMHLDYFSTAAPAGLPARFKVPVPFILYTGNFKPHKNVEGLLEAFSLFKKRTGLPHALVLAGGYMGVDLLLSERAQMERLPVIFTGHVSDEEMEGFYRHADLLVMPSLYEGFGYPVVEAMAHGVAVCSSRSASLPEVAGQAARYFNAEDPEDMAGALIDVLTKPGLKKELSEKGRVEARRFLEGRFAEGFIALASELAPRAPI